MPYDRRTCFRETRNPSRESARKKEPTTAKTGIKTRVGLVRVKEREMRYWQIARKYLAGCVFGARSETLSRILFAWWLIDTDCELMRTKRERISNLVFHGFRSLKNNSQKISHNKQTKQTYVGNISSESVSVRVRDKQFFFFVFFNIHSGRGTKVQSSSSTGSGETGLSQMRSQVKLVAARRVYSRADY